MKILFAEDEASMSRKAANIISAQVTFKPDSVLGLMAGPAALGAYRELIEWHGRGDLDFSRVHTVNLEEYVGLGPQDESSFAWFMHQNLFRHINIDRANTHIPNGIHADPEAECRRYGDLINRLGGIDMQFLCIGTDGCLGFNQPGIAFEKEAHCVQLSANAAGINANDFESPRHVPTQVLSLGLKTIMNARRLLLVTRGTGMADMLREALFGPVSPQLPASIIQLHPDVTIVAVADALASIMAEYPDEVAGRRR